MPTFRSSFGLSTAARRVTVLMAALALCAGFGALAAADAHACAASPFGIGDFRNADGSCFEGGDGNLDRDVLSPGFVDWAEVSDETLYADPSGTGDQGQFTQGSKELEPGSWTLDPSEPNDKSDITAMATRTETAAGDIFLHLAFTTQGNTGSMNASIELNQDPALWDNGNGDGAVIPTRSEGDVLITYDGNQQTSDERIGLCLWKGNKFGQGAGGSGAYGWYRLDGTQVGGAVKDCTQVALADAVAGFNASTTLDNAGHAKLPAPFDTTIAADRFGELSINLSSLLGDNQADPCFDFGSLWVHTREGNSVSAAMEDYVRPRPLVGATNCGGTIDKKVAVGDPAGTYHEGTPADPSYANVGDTLFYAIAITNTGALPFVPTVTDPKCDSAPVRVAPNETDTTFDAGDTWHYACQHVLEAADIDPFTNTAFLHGEIGSFVVDDQDSTDTTRLLTVSGMKYEDSDADGTHDAGEPPLAGWMIFLDSDGDGVYDAGERSAVTQADGTYAIGDVIPTGVTAPLREVVTLAATDPLASWICSDPGNGTGTTDCRHSLTLAAGANLGGRDFGNYRTASISGRKYLDANESAHRDAGEPYLDGWTIYVDLNDNGSFDAGEPSDVTHIVAGQPGGYQITGLTPSATPRVVREVLQPGWTCTDPAQTCTHSVTFGSGDAESADFGNFRPVGVAIDKSGTALAHQGDVLSYEIEVTNDGAAPLSQVIVTDPKCGEAPLERVGVRNDDGDALLEIAGSDGEGPEVWLYACQVDLPDDAITPSPFVNTAHVNAKDQQGRPAADEDDHPTVLINPALDLDKRVAVNDGAASDGPAAAYVGDTLTYTVAVTNTGDTPLTLTWGDDGLSQAFVDARCDAGTIAGPAAGGGDADDVFEPGETWTYRCTHVVTAADSSPIVNAVKVTGVDELGGPKGTRTNTDSTTTVILTPAIKIVKTGPATAVAGELVSYTLDVTNPGVTSFAEGLVVVGDALCQAPPALSSKNGDGSPGTLDPGDRWTYGCQVATQPGQTQVVNVGTVKGTDQGGKVVESQSTATTALSQPASATSPVGPTTVVRPRANARLSGTVACATARYARASVTGSQIRRVTFTLNGRRVSTLTRPNSGSSYVYRALTRSLAYGAYKLSAKVEFTQASGAPARTLRLSFSRCKPRVVRPVFTG